MVEFGEEPPCIEGDCVGAGAQPGRFYLTALAFLAKGTPDDFTQMAASDRLVVRIMGLWCLTQADPTATLPLLKRRLAGQEDLTCFPSGCCGRQISEGQFVWQIIHDRNYLRLAPPEPLLSKDELEKLDREIMDNPSLEHLHAIVKKSLPEPK